MKLAAVFSLTVLVFQLNITAAGATNKVPCEVLAHGVACANPISEGVVDGQWIGLIFMFDGTNGGPGEINIVSIGVGGNGLQTVGLSPIKPVGEYGDRMDAEFRRGKLIVSNAIYLPGEGHCCYTHLTVRQFGFHDHALAVEREASVPASSNAAQIDAALEKGAHYY